MSQDRPILMSAPMVRATMRDKDPKTQTRRLVKGMALEWLAPDMFVPEYVAMRENHMCPYGYEGDTLWVKETYSVARQVQGHDEEYTSVEIDWRATDEMMRWEGVQDKRYHLVYRADGEDGYEGRWHPSIHIPRWASRVNLLVVSVRIERLHAITTEDVLAEGLTTTLREHDAECDLRAQYAALWDALNGKRAPWASNPWVWVITYMRLPQRLADMGLRSMSA